MNELIDALKVLEASTVALKYKAHGFHWNVEGDDFPQWHSKLEDIYEDMEGAVDTFAEWIRMLDVNSYAPFSLSRLSSLSIVPENTVSSDPMAMIADLCDSMDIVTAAIVTACDNATNAKQFGLANFLGDRQTAHQKWCWQLRASLKDVEQD